MHSGRKQKFIAMLCAVFLLCGTLSGCQNPEDETTKVTPAPAISDDSLPFDKPTTDPQQEVQAVLNDIAAFASELPPDVESSTEREWEDVDYNEYNEVIWVPTATPTPLPTAEPTIEEVATDAPTAQPQATTERTAAPSTLAPTATPSPAPTPTESAEPTGDPSEDENGDGDEEDPDDGEEDPGDEDPDDEEPDEDDEGYYDTPVPTDSTGGTPAPTQPPAATATSTSSTASPTPTKTATATPTATATATATPTPTPTPTPSATATGSPTPSPTPTSTAWPDAGAQENAEYEAGGNYTVNVINGSRMLRADGSLYVVASYNGESLLTRLTEEQTLQILYYRRDTGTVDAENNIIYEAVRVPAEKLILSNTGKILCVYGNTLHEYEPAKDENSVVDDKFVGELELKYTASGPIQWISRRGDSTYIIVNSNDIVHLSKYYNPDSVSIRGTKLFLDVNESRTLVFENNVIHAIRSEINPEADVMTVSSDLIALGNGGIYYYSSDGEIRHKKWGESSQAVYSEFSVSWLAFYRNRIYYRRGESRLCSIDLDGADYRSIDLPDGRGFENPAFVRDEKVYYFTTSGDAILRSISLGLSEDRGEAYQIVE